MRRLDLPPVWGALAMLMIWVLARALTLLPAPDGAIWPGRVLIVAGVGYILWSASFFFRRRTPIEPRRTPTALLTEGPFRHTRNPIYRGMILVVTGWALVCGELTGLAIAALYALLLLRRFVMPEEAGLRATFGAAFDAWAAQVRWRL